MNDSLSLSLSLSIYLFGCRCRCCICCCLFWFIIWGKSPKALFYMLICGGFERWLALFIGSGLLEFCVVSGQSKSLTFEEGLKDLDEKDEDNSQDGQKSSEPEPCCPDVCSRLWVNQNEHDKWTPLFHVVPLHWHTRWWLWWACLMTFWVSFQICLGHLLGRHLDHSILGSDPSSDSRHCRQSILWMDHSPAHFRLELIAVFRGHQPARQCRVDVYPQDCEPRLCCSIHNWDVSQMDRIRPLALFHEHVDVSRFCDSVCK